MPPGFNTTADTSAVPDLDEGSVASAAGGRRRRMRREETPQPAGSTKPTAKLQPKHIAGFANDRTANAHASGMQDDGVSRLGTTNPAQQASPRWPVCERHGSELSNR